MKQFFSYFIMATDKLVLSKHAHYYTKNNQINYCVNSNNVSSKTSAPALHHNVVIDSASL